MAWVATPTFVSGNVLTAAQQNILSADLNETAAAKATAAGQLFVSTGANVLAARTPAFASVVGGTQTTASTSFTDLITVGPTVTTTTGTAALVMVSAETSNNTAGGFCQAAYDISGATTLAPSLDRCLSVRSAVSNHGLAASIVIYQTGLTSGSNTFRMKYMTSSGGGTAAFDNRRINVIPL